MSKAMLQLDGKRFVVLPESEYRLLKAQAAGRNKPAAKARSPKRAADAGDAAEARRRLADPRRVDATEVFDRLGV